MYWPMTHPYLAATLLLARSSICNLLSTVLMFVAKLDAAPVSTVVP